MSAWRPLFTLALVVVLVVGANLLVRSVTDAVNFELRPSNEAMVHRSVMALAALYAVLLAVPFVPGVEIGLALMAMLGPPVALLVYVCTVVGLSVSFLVGRLLPERVLVALFDELRMRRASGLLRPLEPMSREQRLAFLVGKAPTRILPLLLRHRHLALALAINLPGNFLLGGGGGISLVAGLSGLYSLPGFVATIVLAVLPVPLGLVLIGPAVLPG